MGSGGRWWALLRRFLYNQVLGRGFMGSRMSPGPPLGKFGSKLWFLAETTFSLGNNNPGGVALVTAHACHRPRGAHGRPKGPKGAHVCEGRSASPPSRETVNGQKRMASGALEGFAIRPFRGPALQRRQFLPSRLHHSFVMSHNRCPALPRCAPRPRNP